MHNHNFDVDWQAYEDVKQGLVKLIELELKKFSEKKL
jgi:hypothetical protein